MVASEYTLSIRTYPPSSEMPDTLEYPYERTFFSPTARTSEADSLPRTAKAPTSNPAARENASSPIYGMPILNVDQASNVVVLKRSMGAGFAGIENELYYDAKTAMLFGDAKASIENLVAGVKSL